MMWTNATAIRRWTRIGLNLVIATMAYNIAEACLALWSGVVAGSIALVGFGLDSVIEALAAGMLLWRLRIADDCFHGPTLAEHQCQAPHPRVIRGQTASRRGVGPA